MCTHLVFLFTGKRTKNIGVVVLCRDVCMYTFFLPVKVLSGLRISLNNKYLFKKVFHCALPSLTMSKENMSALGRKLYLLSFLNLNWINLTFFFSHSRLTKPRQWLCQVEMLFKLTVVLFMPKKLTSLDRVTLTDRPRPYLMKLF